MRARRLASFLIPLAGVVFGGACNGGEPAAPSLTGSADAAGDATTSDASLPDDGSSPLSFTRDGFTVAFDARGALTRVDAPNGHRWLASPEHVRIGVGAADLAPLDAPSRVTSAADGVSFEYERSDVAVRVALSLASVAHGVALRREITVTPSASAAISEPVRIAVDAHIAVPGDATLFVPRRDGIGETMGRAAATSAGARFVYALAGEGLDVAGATRLAVPMLSEVNATGERLTRVFDPTFSASVAYGEARVGWVYRGDAVPLAAPETITLYDVLEPASPGPRSAMDALYKTALADVPAGPAWLHDVVWQHYDYMSHGGRGWFDDIAAAEAMIAPADRSRVMFTLHGWFDVYGRYAFDPIAKRLRDTWTVFPNAAAVSAEFPDLETMAMDKAELHRRIAFAKSRGFRVGFYFADGMATGEDVEGLFSPSRAIKQGGWQGPDTTSPTWTVNPAHPEVAAYFRDYLDALLAEVGSEIDALVWDETFTVRIGEIGPSPAPSYADRGMMRLTRALTQRVSAFRKDLALLTSDDIGLPGFADDVAPYALMGHGTYQDSWSHPDAWAFGLFPNLRNTLWSCNWHPVTHWDYTASAVDVVNAPVATSNGFGDNVGIARLDAPARAALAALVAKRLTTGGQSLAWRAP